VFSEGAEIPRVEEHGCGGLDNGHEKEVEKEEIKGRIGNILGEN